MFFSNFNNKENFNINNNFANINNNNFNNNFNNKTKTINDFYQTNKKFGRELKNLNNLFFSFKNSVKKTEKKISFKENLKIFTENSPKKNNSNINEYLIDILNDYKSNTKNFIINKNYMNNHLDINKKMRKILINWLIEVHLKFKLKPNTLFLSINLIDNFLSKINNLNRKFLQLVGISSLLIASKYEEIFPPKTNDFIFICDYAYNKNELLHMENLILNSIDFNINFPTIFNFFEIYNQLFNFDKKIYFFCLFILELTLLEIDFLNYSSDEICSSAIYFSLKIFGFQKEKFENFCGFSYFMLKNCILDLASLFDINKFNNIKTKSVYKKYSLPEFLEVAKIIKIEI